MKVWLKPLIVAFLLSGLPGLPEAAQQRPEQADPILFAESEHWDRYDVYIVPGAAFVIAQGALIVALLVQAKKRRRAEAKLRDLGRRLLGAQEAERLRIARELHDDISQQATVLAIDLRVLGDNCRNLDNNVGVLAREAAERTKQIVASVRDLSHRLHPAKLRLTGLVPALDSLQQQFSRNGVVVDFSHENLPPALSQDVSLCLFRIVQEALQNAVKHGAAQNVSVRLAGAGKTLTLAIADDGVGFNVDAAASGLGLISMRERLDPMGGSLEIQSRRGVGTRLEISLPIAARGDQLTRSSIVRSQRPVPSGSLRATSAAVTRVSGTARS